MDLSWNTINNAKSKYPEAKKNVGSVDEQDELLHATDNSHDNCCKTGMFALVARLLDNPENCLKLCTLTSNTLSVTVGLKIDPLLICTNPGWFP
jgi:hypothetical protein